MSAYENVVGGGLKLKGIGKKKKKKSSGDEQHALMMASEGASSSGGGGSTSTAYMLGDGHTASEQRKLKMAAKRTVVSLEKGELKTHREKVRAQPSTPV